MKSHMIYQSPDFTVFGAIVFEQKYDSKVKHLITAECADLPLDQLCSRLDADNIQYERYPEQYDGGNPAEFFIRMMEWVGERCPEIRDAPPNTGSEV